MGIEDLKRWHWIALSIPLGLFGAWAMLEAGPLGMQAEYATMGADEFEARVLGRPRWGRATEPPLEVRAYPLGEQTYLVTAYLPVGEPRRDERRRWQRKYRAHQITRAGTYVPLSPLKDPPQFRLRFDDKDPVALSRQRGVAQYGFLRAAAGYRTLQEAGATLEFPLKAGPDYRLMLRLAPEFEKWGFAVQLKLNGQSLPPLTQDGAEPTRWSTPVPAAALKEGKQTLEIIPPGSATQTSTQPTTRPSGAARLPHIPVQVGEIELINPAYTVRDFLADAKAQNGSLDYSYRRAWEPRVAYAGWVTASVIVVGGVWPTVLGLLVGAGFGRGEPEPKYDLSRFKGGKEKRKSKRKPTAAEEAKVRDLADEIERKLLADAQARVAHTAEAPTEPEPVKALVTAPVEAAAEEKPAEKKGYRGEHYPVARNVEKDKDER